MQAICRMRSWRPGLTCTQSTTCAASLQVTPSQALQVADVTRRFTNDPVC